MAQLYRTMSLGGDPGEDTLIFFHRGKTFQYLQRTINDVENDAVVLSIIIWILLDVSSNPG
jgi:hypothetical protein